MMIDSFKRRFRTHNAYYYTTANAKAQSIPTARLPRFISITVSLSTYGAVPYIIYRSFIDCPHTVQIYEIRYIYVE